MPGRRYCSENRLFFNFMTNERSTLRAVTLYLPSVPAVGVSFAHNSKCSIFSDIKLLLRGNLCEIVSSKDHMRQKYPSIDNVVRKTKKQLKKPGTVV